MKNLAKVIKFYFSRVPFIRLLRLHLHFNKLLKPNLVRPLKQINNSSTTTDQCILVPLLETSHYRVYHHLILAKALEARGAKVKVLICDEFLYGCELKNINNSHIDPCLECRFNIKYILPLFNLDYIYLKDLINKKLLIKIEKKAETIIKSDPNIFYYKEIDIMPIVNDSVVRYYYGNTIVNDKEGNQIKYEHLVTSMIGLEAAEHISMKYNPQIILGYMSAYSAWAPYNDYFKKNDIPVINVMSNEFDYHSVQINPMDLYTSKKRYNKYLDIRNNSKLNNSEKKEINNFFERRISGSADNFLDMKNFNIDNQIIFNPQKRNIVLFSNIFWDVGLSMVNEVFNDVNHWIYETIKMISGVESIHLYIKPHPMENEFTDPGVINLLKEKIPILPTNVSVITPDMAISPYSLIKEADLVTVYHGTLGIESLYLGKPVVACGPAPYAGSGLAMKIDDMAKYKNILHNRDKVILPDHEEVEKFAYFYFIKQQIPWKLTDRVYKDNFTGYNINSLDDLLPGKDKYLDHLCDCILDPVNSWPEDWRA